MDQPTQQQIMLRFARCQYLDGSNSYEAADCAGAAQIILREFAGLELPNERTAWSTYFNFLPWPVEQLDDYDVILMAKNNDLGMVDHMAVHVGNRYIVHLAKDQSGLLCERLSRYEAKILYIARYKRDHRN